MIVHLLALLTRHTSKSSVLAIGRIAHLLSWLSTELTRMVADHGTTIFKIMMNCGLKMLIRAIKVAWRKE
jgi:hypothetical protein